MWSKLRISKTPVLYLYNNIKGIKTKAKTNKNKISIIKNHKAMVKKKEPVIKEKILLFGHLLFGVYGFTRGYRASDYDIKYDSDTYKFKRVFKSKLICYRIASGCINTVYYVLPFVNLIFMTNLLGRLEVYYYNRDKNDYDWVWFEMCGMCYDII